MSPRQFTMDPMTLFNPAAKPSRKVGGWAFFSLFLLTVVSLVALPTGYVIERPGQSFNVMGSVAGTPVISSDSVGTYESESRLDVTTVSVVGNRDATPGWLEVIAAWLDPNQIVLPIDEVYPPDRSAAEIRAESQAQMEVSQQDAIAAALIALDYPVKRNIYVRSVFEAGAASSKLVAADLVRSAAGVSVSSFEELREQIQLSEGREIELEVLRDGITKLVSITPVRQDDAWAIGILVGYNYEFPIDIKLQLGNVGGPSGGLMFALGIIDTLTPGSIAADRHIAGTGTINAAGGVGEIGGVELKMIAAKQSGADLFIAPRSNCKSIVGSIPAGLRVAVVRDLEEALDVLVALARDELDTSRFSCTPTDQEN
jgi:Lon-like protease